ncbi:hypothetical protein GCM10010429_24260 [Micromonospora olivasterospora]|uniref:Secreted protein n=1 Tax=Micromonospora olivasterospora TaxID=1880 RepID=A0A562IGJ7_MICOL|nr:secreted protein [Micromonospora olivasterospora]
MALDRRGFLGRVAAAGVATATASTLALPGEARAATWRKRLTGADLETNSRWQVAGTDLGIPYVLENGSIGYLFGDTFNTPWPERPPLPNDWRSPVMLRSYLHPNSAGGIVFDSAARVAGNGRAPELMHNGHNGIGIDGLGGHGHPQRRDQLSRDRTAAHLVHEHRELELRRPRRAALEVPLRRPGVLRQRQRLHPYAAEVCWRCGISELSECWPRGAWQCSTKRCRGGVVVELPGEPQGKPRVIASRGGSARSRQEGLLTVNRMEPVLA